MSLALDDQGARSKWPRPEGGLASVLAATVGALFGAAALAQGAGADAEAVLKQFPSPDRVLETTQGANAIDTAARKRATLWVLGDAVRLVAGRTSTVASPPSLAKTLELGYHAAMQRDGRPAQVTEDCANGADCASNRFFALMNAYRCVDEFRGQVLRQYLPAAEVSQVSAKFDAVPAGRGWRASCPSGGARMPTAAQVSPSVTDVLTARLQRASAGQRQALIGAAIIGAWAVVFLGAMVWRVRLRVETGGDDPGALRIGRKTYQVVGNTGTAYAPRADRVNKVWASSSADGKSVSVHNQEVRSIEFFLKDMQGQDHHLSLRGTDFAVAEGHRVSEVWASPDGKSGGPYLFMRNHTTRQTEVMRANIAQLLELPGWPWLLILLTLPMFCVPLALYWLVKEIARGPRLMRVIRHVHEHWVPRFDDLAARLSTPPGVTRADPA